MKWFLQFLLLSLSVSHTCAENFHIDQDDFKIGLFISAQVEKQYKVLDDHPDKARVMEIASRVIDAAGSGTFYSFQIIEAPVANAFALPGGFVFITDKLLEQKLSDGELAFLLGHEISHVQNNHFERIQKEQAKVSFLNALTTIGAILVASQTYHNDDRERMIRQGATGSAGPPEISHDKQTQLPPHLVPILAGNIFGTLYLLHSQRDFEYEADLSGARIALQAGYSLDEGIGMLKKLFYTNYRNASMEQWTTHPLTQARMLAIRSKVDPSWQQKPKNSIYLEQYRREQAQTLLNLYEEVNNWNTPRGLPKDKKSWDDIRVILLDRARHWSQDVEIQRRALRLELKNHIRPHVESQPFLLADYGTYLNKAQELKELGGELEENIEDIQKKSDLCLTSHREKIATSAPGYRQLKYLVENYPKVTEAESWKWNMWLKERDSDKKLSLAHELWENKTYHEDIKKELAELQKSHPTDPYVYRKSCDIINTEVDPTLLESRLEECEDLKILLRYQHEFPDDTHLDLVNKKRSQLIQQRFRAGRLAALSGQSQKAVVAYNDVLLYDSGSELEEEAREEIFRLNTLSQDIKY